MALLGSQADAGEATRETLLRAHRGMATYRGEGCPPPDPVRAPGARAVVGRISVRLEERFEDLDGTPVQLYHGPGRRIVLDRAPARVP